MFLLYLSEIDHITIIYNESMEEDGTIYLSKAISSYSTENRLIKRLLVHDCYIDGKLVESQAFEDPNREHNLTEVIKVLESKGFVDIRAGGHQTEDVPQENTSIYSIRCRKNNF